MTKNKNLFIRLESKVLDWLFRNRIKVFRFAVLALILLMFSSLPYLNLIFTTGFTFYLIAILGTIFFGLSTARIIFLCIFLFGIALIFTLIGDTESAEILTNFIYFLLVWGTIRFTFKNT